MSSQVASELREIKNINTEITRISKSLRKLRARKKELETDIIKYLTETGQESIRYEDIVVEKTEGVKRNRKKKKEKEEDVLKILMKYTPHSSDKKLQKMQEEIFTAVKGEPVQVDKLKTRKTKTH